MELSELQLEAGRLFLGVASVGGHDDGFEPLERLRSLCWGEDTQLVHACAHGLKDPATGLPWKKPLMLFSPVRMN